MKARKNKRFVPTFMRKLDEHLLFRYPTVWETQIHFVLFYALIAAIVFFIIGLCYPNSVKEPLVKSLEPIIIHHESYFLIFLMICVPAVIYWGYQQFKTKKQNISLIKSIAYFFLYGLAFFFIFGITIPSFRIGTIVNTAYFLLDKEDFESMVNNEFLYGIMVGDSIDKNSKMDTIINKWEKEFKAYKEKEDAQLNEAYKGYYRLGAAKFYKYRGYSSSLSYLSNRSYLSDISNVIDTIKMSEMLKSLNSPVKVDTLHISILEKHQKALTRNYRRSDYPIYLNYLSKQFDRIALHISADINQITDIETEDIFTNESLEYVEQQIALSNMSHRPTKLFLAVTYRIEEGLQNLDIRRKTNLTKWWISGNTNRFYKLDEFTIPPPGFGSMQPAPELSFRELIERLDKHDFSGVKLFSHYDGKYKNNHEDIFKKFRNKYQVDGYSRLNYLNYIHILLYIKRYDKKPRISESELTERMDRISGTSLDSLKTKTFNNLNFYTPSWFYQMEKGFRSSQNSRRYIKNMVFINYFKWLLHYLPFLCIFFLALKQSKSNSFFTAIYIYLSVFIFATVFGQFFFDITNKTLKNYLYLNNVGIICGLFFTSFLLLWVSHKKNNAVTDFLFQMALMPLIFFFMAGILCDYHYFLGQGLSYSISCSALFTIQAIGISAVLLMTHIRSLPRS